MLLIIAASSQTVRATNPDSLRDHGFAKLALDAYRDNYRQNPADGDNLYSYCCLLARTGQTDSAYRYAFLTAAKYTAPLDLLKAPDLVSIHADYRWSLLEDSALRAAYRLKGFNLKRIDLSKRLWRMAARDQAYYADIEITRAGYGSGSSVEQSLWSLKEYINLDNVKELEALVAKNGWPKTSDVGAEAANAAFLIIQHADANRQNKYLPVIKAMCTAGEASWESYALLYDRVQISKGNRQLYGSQLFRDPVTGGYKLYPIEAEPEVDKRRAAFGMEPLVDYLKGWNITYKPAQ